MEYTQPTTSPAVGAIMPDMAQMEQQYHEIVELYDFAEKLVETVELQANEKEAQEQLDLVEPLIAEVSDGADILSEEFIAIAESNGKKRPRSKGKIEGALRRIYMAIDAYQQQVGDGVRNIANPIVQKIKRQMETIIATFIDWVELSLDRMMQKSDVEALKQRQEKIAMMLHQMGQGA